MHRRNILSLSAITIGVSLLASGASAQQKSLREQLVGSWSLVTSAAFGEKPAGALIFDSSGRFSGILMRSNLPKYAVNNRLQGTPAEYKATVEGSLAYFGTWTIEGTDLKMHIEGSTFPNWTNTDQKRTNVTISGDELRYTQPAPSGGGDPTPLVWRRAK